MFGFQDQMAGEVNPMIRQWMVGMTSQQLHRVLATVTITDQQVQHYIVRRAGPETPAQASSQRATSPPITVPKATATPTAAAGMGEIQSSPAHSQSSEASFVSAEGDSEDKREQVNTVKLG